MRLPADPVERAAALDIPLWAVAPRARRSEYVWHDCPRCGASFECTGIRDVIAHARSEHSEEC